MNNLKKTVSRSYARKLNLQKYGGNPYETTDFWASYSEEVPIETSSQDLQKVSQKLYELAKEDIERSVQQIIDSLRTKNDLQKSTAWADEVAIGKRNVHDPWKYENN